MWKTCEKTDAFSKKSPSDGRLAPKSLIHSRSQCRGSKNPQVPCLEMAKEECPTVFLLSLSGLVVKRLFWKWWWCWWWWCCWWWWWWRRVLLSERPGMNLPFFMFSFTLFLIIFDYSLGLKERSLTFGAFWVWQSWAWMNVDPGWLSWGATICNFRFNHVLGWHPWLDSRPRSISIQEMWWFYLINGIFPRGYGKPSMKVDHLFSGWDTMLVFHHSLC